MAVPSGSAAPGGLAQALVGDEGVAAGRRAGAVACIPRFFRERAVAPILTTKRLADIVSRTIMAPEDVPIGVITGLAGGLAFILLLRRR